MSSDVTTLNVRGHDLRVRGHDPLLKRLEEGERAGIGVCGGRNAGPEALEFARDVGREIAEMEFVLVSGNARGVDEQAELAALGSGGDVISVLAQGFTPDWKPRQGHRPWIDENYAVVSEFEPGARWTVGRAMERNKTIIDLSMAMVAIHAGEKGGTLNAGKKCLEAKKRLLVAQGEGVEAEGSRELIKKGGIAFQTMEEFRALIEGIRAEEPLSTSSSEEQLALL